LLQRINHGGTNSIWFTFVCNLRCKSLWNPTTVSHTVNHPKKTEQLVLSPFVNKKFENCFVASQAE